MGASNSKSNNEINYSKIIDKIASTYILSMNFQDMLSLTSEEGCNNMIITTASILENYQTLINLKNIYQDKTDDKSENIFSFPIENIKSLNIENSAEKKKICREIAKYYIQIAHLFSAIISSINPKYQYSDNGELTEVNILNKNSIPEEFKNSIAIVNDSTFCSERLKLLTKDSVLEDKGEITIGIPYCSLNSELNFYNSPGIKELEDLFKDEFDSETGVFSMSNEGKKQYEQEIKKFYSLMFESSKSAPSSFSDIDYPEYNKELGCKEDELLKVKGLKRKKLTSDDQDDAPPYKEKYYGTNSGLFELFNNNIKEMQIVQDENTKIVFGNLGLLFNLDKDPIELKPNLKQKDIEEITLKTRNDLIKLYYNCEKYFQNGLAIFRDIVNEQLIKTDISDIKSLDLESEKLLAPEK
jgi:hypothetical protein